MHSISIRHKCPMQYATGKRTKFTNSSAKKLDQEISDSVINIGLTSCRLIQFLKTIEKTPILSVSTIGVRFFDIQSSGTAAVMAALQPG